MEARPAGPRAGGWGCSGRGPPRHATAPEPALRVPAEPLPRGPEAGRPRAECRPRGFVILPIADFADRGYNVAVWNGVYAQCPRTVL